MDLGRLIPAHAGKTSLASIIFGANGAHPRSRGENFHCENAAFISVGSSPLTRGKRPDARKDARDQGLIPAHAGKTCRALTIRSTGGAHPRSRGENHEPRRERPLMPGSSPLTRGKRAGDRRCLGPQGLIPAHAGKTQ